MKVNREYESKDLYRPLNFAHRIHAIETKRHRRITCEAALPKCIESEDAYSSTQHPVSAWLAKYWVAHERCATSLQSRIKQRVGQWMTMMAATSDERSVMEPARTNSGQSQPIDRLKLLYPMVNEEETPLPRSWSPKDKYNYIGLSQNNLRVHYKGTYKKAPCATSARDAPTCATRPSRFYSFVESCHRARARSLSRGRGRAAIGLLPGQGRSID